jgi:putative hydrolase of the HAD superfamily
LAPHFDVILIEGEIGFGKPDRRIYERALAELSIEAADAWMAGDNFEWDVAQPQRLGMTGVWVNPRGSRHPEGARIHADFMVRSISELRGLLERAS